MTTIYQDYINDLKDSLSTPLLIEVQKKHIEELQNNDSAFSDEVSYHNIYDKSSTHNNTTNVVVVNAIKGDNTQILNAFYEKTNIALKNKLGINSLVKAGVYFATMGLGELVSKDITNKASELLGDNLDKVTKVFDNDWIKEQISKKVTEKPANIVTDAAEDIGNTQAEKLNEKHQFGSELFVSESAKASLLALANNMSEYHTPHQAMQFTLKLITALSLDAPKLIVINNPFNLDSASLSLLSLLFSHAKDLKEKGQSTNISVLFNYTGPQPYDEPEQSDELESEAYKTFIKLKRLRHMVQRYGMLEKPGSCIPTPAIKSTTFVGRVNEINDLTKAHASFVAFHQENKYRKKTSQWTLVKGEPGTGKTALINKHLANIDEKNDALSQSQIRLRQLNQVGHSSEVTGLASLLQSIQAEAERLTQYYQANQNFIQEKIADTSLAYKNSKADLKNLKDNRRGLFKLIKSATEFAVDVGNLGTPYRAAASAIDALTLDNKKLQTGAALQQEGSINKKQEQFNQLNMALRYLSNIAQVIDEKAAQMPILLFVDDLQWIDELTAEFILVHLLPSFPSELLFTARGSDSETSYKLAVEGQKHSPYKLALFDAAKLSTFKLSSETKPSTLAENKQITLQPQIVIKGMDLETLSELIDLTYTNSSEMQIDAIAKAVINALSTEGITESTQVVTLFAIETLNLVSDPAFYQKNKLPTALIIQPKKGVYEINPLEQQALINTVENIFTLLRDAHTQAYTHDSMQSNSENHFTLSSYAVMEERLFLIGQYFNEYSDAAIFSLQLSALIGAPFDSELVRKLILKLSDINEDEYSELKPIKKLLGKHSEKALSPEHLEVLEEVLAILKRLQSGGIKHQYHHGLFALFLCQQFTYRLNELFNYHKNTHAVNVFFEFCHLQLIMQLKAVNRIALPSTAEFELKLYLLNALVCLCEMAFKLDEVAWSNTFARSLNNLAFSYKTVGRADEAITLEEQALHIREKLYNQNNARWAEGYTIGLNNLATSYYTVGRCDEAITLAEQALYILEKLYSHNNDHWGQRYASSLNNLAVSYKTVGRINEAISLQKQALNILETLYGQNNERWAEDYTIGLNNLATSYYTVGRSDGAIILQEQALHIREKLYSQNNDRWAEDYTNILNNLAASYSVVGRIEEAISLQKQALHIREKLYSQNNGRWAEDYTSSLNNLATSYYTVGRSDEAMNLQEQGLHIREKLYNENNGRWAEDYTSSLNNLAVSYYTVDRSDEAIILQEQALHIREKLYSENNGRWVEDYTNSLNNLAASYSVVGRVDEAIPLREQALHIREKLYSENNGRWAENYTSSLNNLAASYKEVCRTDEAISLQKQALNILEMLYGQNNARWAEGYSNSINNLAVSYYTDGRTDDAIPLQKQALHIREKLYSQSNDRWAEDYTSSLNNLAASYSLVGRIDEAISLQKQALHIREKLYDEGSGRWAKDYTSSLNNLAASYSVVGRIDEAISLEEQALHILEKHYSQNNDRWAEDYTISLNNLAVSYNAVGRVDEAIPLKEQALQILEKLYSQNNERWLNEYSSNLDNLAFIYDENNQDKKALACYRKLKTLSRVINNEEYSNNSICELRMLNRLKEYVAFEELALNHQSEFKQYPNEAWIPRNQVWLLGVWGNSYHERGLINQAKEKISEMSLLITEYQLENFESFNELIQQYVN